MTPLRPKLTTSLMLTAALAMAPAACGDDTGGDDGPPDAAENAQPDAGTASDGGEDASTSEDAGTQPPADAQVRADAFVADCTPVSGTEIALELLIEGDGENFIRQPLYVTSPPNDPRLFVVERCGIIRIIYQDGGFETTPFLDIAQGGDTPRVNCTNSGEMGLLGLVFHPNYADNGRFFIHYTEGTGPSNRYSVIAEYTVSDDANVANTSEKRLLQVRQPNGNHNAGMLAFGPRDGHLYIGMGDGGNRDDTNGNGQNLTSLLGAMLRIDVDREEGDTPYAIPADNPYADSNNGEEDPRPEIWAIGLRNPWRFSFDRETGDMYIADVGQDQWEEIDFQPANSTGGENYGWPEYEGSRCYLPAGGGDCEPSDKVMPIVEYPHPDEPEAQEIEPGKSVTGGFVYRGQCFPDIRGRYFYADYVRRWIQSFVYTGGEVTDQQLLGGPRNKAVASFGEDAAGELYVIDIADNAIYRLTVASE